MSEAPGTRSVKIGADERTGWSSDRPRGRDGADRPPRPVDISTRNRVLRPAERMRYSPGSLVVVVAGSVRDRDPFVRRVFEEQGAVFSHEKIRAMLAGRVPEAEIEGKADELLDATVARRMESGATVVLPVAGLDPAHRERYVRMAHAHRRPRHLIFIESAREAVAEEDRPVVNELRRALDAGELGEEGFQTCLRLGGAAVGDLKRIVFRPPPRDDD